MMNTEVITPNNTTSKQLNSEAKRIAQLKQQIAKQEYTYNDQLYDRISQKMLEIDSALAAEKGTET